ncbi:hypothetical protein OTU49_003437, partial [Cherax quadricarinatus]
NPPPIPTQLNMKLIIALTLVAVATADVPAATKPPVAAVASPVTAELCSLPYCKIIAGQEVRCENPGAWFEYYPHPTNRHLFVQCTTYGPQVMSCAPGTAWSQPDKVCIFETFVPSCTADATVCDCDVCYRGDPNDTTSYYYCSLDANGQRCRGAKMTCGAGTTWDKNSNTCV